MLVDFSLYLITDRHQVHPHHDLFSAVADALQGGVQAVQLREKDLSAAVLFELGIKLRRLTHQYHAKLLINDRIDIALAVDADGVHLTEQSLSVAHTRQLLGADKLIAASTHNLERAHQAEAEGADFITFSPVYYTASKAAYGNPQGLEKLREVCEQATIPVFALGGITPQRMTLIHEAGARGMALISAILADEDPRAAAQRFYNPTT
ncbi:MAG: thiamine phosphate synthase [Thermodesulfobacteriota bacterium]|nr:thiamine phosphate synthase [Thermodesulfobacteriota bacterium]